MDEEAAGAKTAAIDVNEAQSVTEQLPAIDAALARLDKRIDATLARIRNDEEQIMKIALRVERRRRYLRQLSDMRGEAGTFRLL